MFSTVLMTRSTVRTVVWSVRVESRFQTVLFQSFNVATCTASRPWRGEWKGARGRTINPVGESRRGKGLRKEKSVAKKKKKKKKKKKRRRRKKKKPL